MEKACYAFPSLVCVGGETFYCSGYVKPTHTFYTIKL